MNYNVAICLMYVRSLKPLSNTYCNEPYRTIHYDHEGLPGPCCTYRGERYTGTDAAEYWNSSWLRDFREQLNSGVKPPGCSNCWRKEEQGVRSQRQEKFAQHGYTRTPQIKELFLSFGNICNKTCNICRPQRSSLIAKEYKQIDRDDPWLQWSLQHKPRLLRSLDKSFSGYYLNSIDDYYSAAASADVIVLDGGEAFITRQCDELLDWMLAQGMTNKTINAVTNGSVRRDQLDKLAQFKQCNFHISIDGIEELYEFVRPPHPWSWWCEQLNTIKQYPIELRYACVVHAFNVHQLPRILDYFIEQGSNFYFSAVNTQPHLEPSVVPDVVLMDTIEQLQRYNLQGKSAENLHNAIQYLQKGVGTDRWSEQFKMYMNTWSKIKGIQYEDYIPWINQ